VQVIRPVDEQAGLPSPIAITGAARGIGLATARLAALAGTKVALLDRDKPALKRAADAVRGDFVGSNATGADDAVIAVPCDVADEDAVADAFTTVAERLGPPRGLVASAGIDRGGRIDALDPAQFDDVVRVNLRGTFLTCRAAIGSMLGNDLPIRGAIVCISSPFAHVAAPATGAYASTKGGISALVRALAVDYGAEGIRVNAVLPGPTETSLMWANVPDHEVEATRAAVADEVPLARLADPEEPARAALWLLSDRASYVTGAELPCDGGVLAKASISV
jgi:NAD(P)-dependent dehydrogenase (short-subunit alcohol dehydrogenase family)